MTRTLALALSTIAVVAAGPTVSSAANIQAQASPTDNAFARFAPDGQSSRVRLDWSFYDEALGYFVLYMGPSLREAPFPFRPPVGSRVRYGHDSRYRLEGNRIVFELLSDDEIAPLTEYRKDLERIGTELDLASLSRNEQLAFWLNLHNVAIIEQIGIAYPIKQPRNILIDGVPLDEARFITVDGVAMSPRDIRTKIVFPNWRDPRVIYGFFRGDIGSPTLQELAFTGNNVDVLLDLSAKEFVNSLRGVERRGDALKISRVYEEARGFYFPGQFQGLKSHLRKFAGDEVAPLLDRTSRVEADIYEYDIADLSQGDIMPARRDLCGVSFGLPPILKGIKNPDCTYRPIDVPLLVQYYSAERARKVDKLIRTDRYGRVYVFPEGEEPTEVE